MSRRRSIGLYHRALGIIPGGVNSPVRAFKAVGVPHISTINQGNFSLPALIVSLLGAVVLLSVVSLFRRGTAR